MTDQELATRLLEIVEPGCDTLRYLANSSDAGMAVVDLTNIAASRRVCIPHDLLDAIGALVLDGTGLDPRRLTTCAAIWRLLRGSHKPRSEHKTTGHRVIRWPVESRCDRLTSIRGCVGGAVCLLETANADFYRHAPEHGQKNSP